MLHDYLAGQSTCLYLYLGLQSMLEVPKICLFFFIPPFENISKNVWIMYIIFREHFWTRLKTSTNPFLLLEMSLQLLQKETKPIFHTVTPNWLGFFRNHWVVMLRRLLLFVVRRPLTMRQKLNPHWISERGKTKVYIHFYAVKFRSKILKMNIWKIQLKRAKINFTSEKLGA